MTITPTRDFIFQEMLAHSALFSHKNPRKIAILGLVHEGTLNEILKHTSVVEVQVIGLNDELSTHDSRLTAINKPVQEWVLTAAKDQYDVCFVLEKSPSKMFLDYYHLLHTDGILLQLNDSPFEVSSLKAIQKDLLSAGFSDVLSLNFPQPDFPTGWRSAFLVKKKGILKKIREKDIYNKNFSTEYYNFDVHKAALALPEFMRKELIES